MSKLRDRRVQAEQTSKATKRIGLVAQLVVEAGIAPHGRGITNAIKLKCFRPYGNRNEDDVRKDVETAAAAAIKDLSITNFSVGPVLSVRTVPDTSLTSTSRWTDGMYSMKTYDKADRFTHKRHADMTLDLMSDEINDLEGKKFWGHVNWKPLTEDYGGEYALNLEERNNELALLITWLPNKRAATELVNALRNGDTTTDDLAISLGYDVDAVRKAIREASVLKEGGTPEAKASPKLTQLGAKTKATYMTIQAFTKPTTVDFLRQNLDSLDGDINALANKCDGEPGDMAIILDKPEFFRTLMDQTGLGEQEALVAVAESTGLASPVDLAAFLGIQEASF